MSAGLPRYVALRDADNELPVDLENILSIEAVVDVLKTRGQATLVEMFPACEELCRTRARGTIRTRTGRTAGTSRGE